MLGRLAPRRTRLAVATALLALVGSTAASAATVFPGPVDDYASYQGEDGCRDRPMKGTRMLAAWIDKKFEGGRPDTSTRACSKSVSEHEDGRAIDWTMDAAKAADRAEVDRFLAKIFATDADGQPHALARRMGIMYVIWNDSMYRAYGNPRFAKDPYLSSSCPRRKTCSKTLRHRDHVHLSLGKPGGRAETTWYDRVTS